MIKTSTSLNTVNYPSQHPAEKAVDETKNQEELFYDSIKQQLDQLKREPSQETIDKILAYAKKK